MQPENNGQNVASIPVETNTVTPKANDDIVFQDKPKKNTAMILCLVFLVLLAAGGIGFGVWAMMDGNSQKEQLNTQITSLKGQVSELQGKIGNNTIDDCVLVDDVENNNADETNYIYVGEWGIKIKKPENWINLIRKYSFENNAPQGVDSFEIRENTHAGGGVVILRQESCTDSLNSEHAACIELGGKVYVVKELVSELTPGAVRDITDEFWKYITDMNNYSKI